MAALTIGETLTIRQAVASATAVEARLGGPSATTQALALDSGLTWAANIDTADLLPGEYALQLWATFEDGTIRIVSSEPLTLRSPLTVGDIRSNARKALDAIEAMLAGQANEGVRRYRINNRELERYTVDELLRLRSHFAAEVQKENRRNKGMTGLGPRIAVRF
jgi:hypothetical protein